MKKKPDCELQPIQSKQDLKQHLLSKNQDQDQPQFKGESINFKNNDDLNKGLQNQEDFYKTNQEEQTLIYLDGMVVPPKNLPNKVINTKYTIQNFVPKVLYNQFKYFFNLFFLIVAMSQFIPVLKVGFLFSYVAPLVFVLIITMAKEAYDDYKRYLRDLEANSSIYKVLTQDGEKDTKSSDLKVGDIVEINVNQKIPADIIVLTNNDPEGCVFIRTDQLDGETDWKLRKSIKYTQNHSQKGSIFKLKGCVTVEAPRNNIYDFVGIFKIEAGGGDSYREGLSLENTMWANTFLAAGKVQGLIIYTGKETRSSLNSKDPRSKEGRLDMELNYLSKVCFSMMCMVSVFIVLIKGLNNNSILELFRFILLLSSIIPISMRVNLDMAKLAFSYKINNDQNIKGAVARNSQIPEDLGRVEFILSDKTGTLTQNEMIFKRLSLEEREFNAQDQDKIKEILQSQCKKSSGPLKDVEEKLLSQGSGNFVFRPKILRREFDCIVRDLITALCLCHNVTPVKEDGQTYYQASSPDEIALVQIAESMDMRLVLRDQKKIQIVNANGDVESYKILANFPFTSESKRMGIILKHEESSRIVFYLKGADTIMKNKVPEVQRGFLMDECENLAIEGLRTLVITQKLLTQPEFDDWFKIYDEANAALVNRDKQVNKAIERLEINMEFLGITGVQDKLQEDVDKTIENLRNAGIKVWMLTGDKVETAACIAISTGLKKREESIYYIRDITDKNQLQTMLNSYSTQVSSHILVIDGISLATALEFQEELFFNTVIDSSAVLCCRCSPTQKAIVTEKIKNYTGKITLAIGDGGNDVGMITSANVGVGIVGKEGKQAALASDFSILRFKDLAPLLLWHGRNAYKRTSVVSQFVMHRGIIISIIQAIFSSIFYFVAIPIYNGWLMLGYTTVYTMFPVFSLILNNDVNYKAAMEFPELYKALCKGRDLCLKTFLIWVFKSVYQGSVIFLMALVLFDHSFLQIVTITFTALVVAELLNIITEANKFNLIIVSSQCATFLLYILSIVYLKEYMNTDSISLKFFEQVLIICLVSWFPIHLITILIERSDPSDYQKIMKYVKKKQEAELHWSKQNKTAQIV